MQAQTTANPDEPGREETESPVAVVLSGGGARAAYEVGVMSILLPLLEERDERPTVFLGTSAGAINTVLFAALSHLPAKDAVHQAVELWLSFDKRQVFEPVLMSVPPRGWEFLGGLINLPDRLSGLLDNRPLLEMLETRLDWSQFHRNLRGGDLDAVAVATTTYPAGRTAVFAEGRLASRLPATDDDKPVDYVQEDITPQHVWASAAIPVLFPAVRLATAHPEIWHLDGGIRFNTPIKPAIEMQAAKVLMIGTSPARHALARPAGANGRPPTIQEAGALCLEAIQIDPMIQDLRNLARVNRLLESRSTDDRPDPSGGDYYPVDYTFAGPEVRGLLGLAAETVLGTQFSGVQGLLHPDLKALSFLLGSGANRGELLSYLFFEPAFVERAIELGMDDANRMVARSEGEIWERTAMP